MNSCVAVVGSSTGCWGRARRGGLQPRSSRNPKRRHDGSGLTGQTFDHFATYLKKQRPVWCYCEMALVLVSADLAFHIPHYTCLYGLYGTQYGLQDTRHGLRKFRQAIG